MFLATCLFGVTFIVLENTAPNSIAFAQNVLDAAQTPATPGKIIAIALAANTVCCLLHSLSRKWGILLNNFFGVVKFFILVFVIVIGLAWINRDVAGSNYAPSTSFKTPENESKLPHRYAEAIIYIMYPYGGFHQINYVCCGPAGGCCCLLTHLLGHIRTQEPSKGFPTGLMVGSLDGSSLVYCRQHDICKCDPLDMVGLLTTNVCRQPSSPEKSFSRQEASTLACDSLNSPSGVFWGTTEPFSVPSRQYPRLGTWLW